MRVLIDQRQGTQAQALCFLPCRPHDEALFENLREWRSEIAQSNAVPAFVIFHQGCNADGHCRAPAGFGPRPVKDSRCGSKQARTLWRSSTCCRRRASRIGLCTVGKSKQSPYLAKASVLTMNWLADRRFAASAVNKGRGAVKCQLFQRPLQLVAPDEIPVRIIRSAKRRKTISSQWRDNRLVVQVPAALDEKSERTFC